MVVFIADVSEPVKKKLRTMNMAKEEDREQQDEDECKEEGAEEGENADMYQHIKESKKTFDAQVLDAATKVSCHTIHEIEFSDRKFVTSAAEIVAK
jgi:hypothetical protein